MLSQTIITIALASAVFRQSTTTGLAGSAPTAGPSRKTGRLPALGWNSWNAYNCDVDEGKILSAAQDIVSLGLKDAGYEYVNIDDCWANFTRDSSTGRLVPNSTTFPSGIDVLAEQIHSLGLKIGIYSDAGTETCAGRPGSLGSETIDAETFSEWGIDYLKYDNCAVPANWTDTGTPENNDYYNSNTAIRYRRMAGALSLVSRPIQFELCEWGTANVWEWGARVGHSWRISADASASWAFVTSVLSINVQHLDAIGFYAHNDMDMMEIGNGNLTIEEQRSHFAAWAFLKSPILLGTDLSLLSSEELEIIKNKELLAFSQDPVVAGPAKPFASDTSTPPQFYSGKSSRGVHVFIMNQATNVSTLGFDFGDVEGLKENGTYLIHDMWTGKDLGRFSGNYSTTIASRDTAAFLLTK